MFIIRAPGRVESVGKNKSAETRDNNSTFLQSLTFCENLQKFDPIANPSQRTQPNLLKSQFGGAPKNVRTFKVRNEKSPKIGFRMFMIDARSLRKSG